MDTATWNDLAPLFDQKIGSLPKGSEDKILIAWPAIFSIIDRYATQKMLGRFLDFGCGTGEFTIALTKKSPEVTGLDPAAEMIKIAKTHNNGSVRFVVGDASILTPKQNFDCITSIMVLQYVENITGVLSQLSKHLEKDGIFILAVHNPAYIEHCLKEGSHKYVRDNTGKIWIRYRDRGAVEMFVRPAEFYVKEFAKAGLHEYDQMLPPFPESYISTYGKELKGPFDVPKFLIMAFTKA